jgi:hypothetical protein
MKIFAGLLERSDPDIMGEERIHGPMEFFFCKSKVGFETGNLGEGMHARIGSARSRNGNVLFGDFGQCPFEIPLDGLFSWLPLPTVIVGSIVADFYPVVLKHGISFSIAKFPGVFNDIVFAHPKGTAKWLVQKDVEIIKKHGKGQPTGHVMIDVLY